MYIKRLKFNYFILNITCFFFSKQHDKGLTKNASEYSFSRDVCREFSLIQQLSRVIKLMCVSRYVTYVQTRYPRTKLQRQR